jgi:hypothetical protein
VANEAVAAYLSNVKRRRRRIVASNAAAPFATIFRAPIRSLEDWFRANTGPRVPLTNRVTGDVTVTTQQECDDLVGAIVAGRVLINGADLELQDFGVEWDHTGTGATLLQTLNGEGGTHIHHFLLDGHMGNFSYGLGGTSYSENLLVTNGEIRQMGGDGFRTHKNSTYRHLYVHSFRDWVTARDGVYDPNGSQSLFPHTDGMQNLRSGNLVEECWIANTPAQNATSAVIVKSDADEQIDGFTMRRCYVSGGGVIFYIDNQNSDADNPGANGQPDNLVFEDIRVDRRFRDTVWRHGEVPSENITKTDVRYADNDEPVEDLFVDVFNRANENVEANASWQRMSGAAGALTVDTNQVRSNSTAQATYLVAAAQPVDTVNHFVEANWKSGTTTGWLVARYVDENNYVGMQILGGAPTLYQRIGGAFSVLGASGSSLSAGDVVRIECRGQQVKLIHKGILRVTATLPKGALTAGRVGMQARTAIANPMLDNFIAGTLEA